MRFVLADFDRDERAIRVGHIRRIGRNNFKSLARDRSEQIALLRTESDRQIPTVQHSLSQCSSARSEMSTAVIIALGHSCATAIAIAPEPVPTSRILGCSNIGCELDRPSRPGAPSQAAESAHPA